jgi:hypothetical protein
MLLQIASLAGAALILSAYVALQLGWLSATDRMYNLLNLVGAALLAWVAITDRRIGFILLEVIWAAVSIPPLLRASGKGPPTLPA